MVNKLENKSRMPSGILLLLFTYTVL